MGDKALRIARGSGDGFGVDDISCAAMVELGFLAGEGLDVEWVDARGGLAAMTAVLEGRAEVAYGGFGPIVSLRAQGKPCRIFVSQARALAQALVTKRSVSDPAQLKGKTWAVDAIGALSHHMARLLVRALAIAENDIRWQPVGPPPLRIAALLESFDSFRRTVRAYVKLALSDDELRLLWQREHDSRGWAADGELSRGHWEAQLALYRALDPAARAVTFDELITTEFL